MPTRAPAACLACSVSAALPRRLALDFRDVFASGFGFDQASGNIELVSGVAHTDDLVIESTAAQLRSMGSSDLVSQQLDYQMSRAPRGQPGPAGYRRAGRRPGWRGRRAGPAGSVAPGPG